MSKNTSPKFERLPEWFDPPRGAPSHKTGSSFARSTSIAFIFHIARSVILFGTNLILMRMLAPAEFGLFAMLSFFVVLAATLNEAGLSSAAIQARQVSNRQVSTLFWTNLLIGTALALLISLSGSGFASLFNEPRLASLAPYFAIPVFLDALAMQHIAILKRRLSFFAVGCIDVLAALTGAATAIGLALQNPSVVALMIMPIVIAFIRLTLVVATTQWIPLPVFSIGEAKRLIRFGGNVTLFNLLIFLTRNLDNFLVGKFFGSVALGQYSRGYDLLLQPVGQFTTPLQSTMLPYFSRTADHPDMFRKAFLDIISLLLTVFAPVACVAICVGDLLIENLFGTQWNTAGIIFRILGACLFFQPLTRMLGILFISQGRDSELRRCATAAGSLTLLSFLIGLPWGPIGVASSYAVGYNLLQLPTAIYFAGRKGAVSSGELVGCLAKGVPTTLLMLIIGYAIRVLLGNADELSQILASVIAIGVIWFLAALLVHRPFEQFASIKDFRA